MAFPVIPGHDVAVLINVTSAPPAGSAERDAPADRQQAAEQPQLTQAERDAGRRQASAVTREGAEAAVRQAQAAQQRNQAATPGL